MALKRLTTQEMLEISAPWVDRGGGDEPARRALASIPEAAVLLPRIEQAHQGLLHTRRTGTDPGLEELATTAAAVDAVHDDLVRGIHAVLTGFAALAGEAHEAARLHALRDQLLPGGLSATQLTYREEARLGQAVAADLDEEARAALHALPMPTGSLRDAVERWLWHAQRLGELEDERAVRQSARRDGSEEEAEVQARNRWIRVVTALVTNLELGTAPPERVSMILEPLRLAERRTEQATGVHPKTTGTVVPESGDASEPPSAGRQVSERVEDPAA